MAEIVTRAKKETRQNGGEKKFISSNCIGWSATVL